jgi:cardiolipin-specific phospholipase
LLDLADDRGASFFFRNWESVATSAASTGRRTFFLDWLGMGLSSRPSPHLLHSPSSTPIPARVARAEHFFLDSLESWRESTGVDRMVLVGHSLGAYLASAYAVRYPHRVSGLILVSPAGIPHGPEYKRYAPSGEKNEGDREEAVDAVEQEVNGVEHQAKGEAKQWGKNPSLTRRSMMKCESA